MRILRSCYIGLARANYMSCTGFSFFPGFTYPCIAFFCKLYKQEMNVKIANVGEWNKIIKACGYPAYGKIINTSDTTVTNRQSKKFLGFMTDISKLYLRSSCYENGKVSIRTDGEWEDEIQNELMKSVLKFMPEAKHNRSHKKKRDVF